MTISDLYARLRNLFNVGVFKKRDKETVTVQTEFGRTLEAAEVFPYGFIAKATEGRSYSLKGEMPAPFYFYRYAPRKVLLSYKMGIQPFGAKTAALSLPALIKRLN